MRIVSRVFACAVLLGTLGGCKQGLGDRCQIDSDCEAGLVCSAGTNPTCVESRDEGMADAPPPLPVDAATPVFDAPIDGPGVDAPDVDAPGVDASIDAAT